jgi:hypothetical protein
MDVAITIGLIIGGLAIYLDQRSKSKKFHNQLKNLSVSMASFLRRCELLQAILTVGQKEEYENMLERDKVAKLIIETNLDKRTEYLKDLGPTELAEYNNILIRVSQMKGSGE